MLLGKPGLRFVLKRVEEGYHALSRLPGKDDFINNPEAGSQAMT